jgi:hypothetical protein
MTVKFVKTAACTVAFMLGAGAAGPALAWGATGHRIIGRVAMRSLPPEAPAFLRTPSAAIEVGELAREPDRWKGSGKTHDSDRDAAHFLDLEDDGRVLGGPALAALPQTRADYEGALRAAGQDSWKAGYLPYSIVDGWQQLVKDFAYIRIDAAAARNARDPARRAWFAADGARRRSLVLRDIGVFAHYVGDGSQPLHVSAHYNGWGDYPNPEDFTQERVHGPFEGAFVRAVVREAAVMAKLPPQALCNQPIDACTRAYLQTTAATVIPFYRLQKAGGLSAGDPRGRAFAVERIAAGAAQLRDLITTAWRASATADAGWPPVRAADVEAGRVDPYDSLLGAD